MSPFILEIKKLRELLNSFFPNEEGDINYNSLICDKLPPKYSDGVCLGATIEAARIWLKHKDVDGKDFVSKMKGKDLLISDNTVARVQLYHDIFYKGSKKDIKVDSVADLKSAINSGTKFLMVSLAVGADSHAIGVQFKEIGENGISCKIFDCNIGNSIEINTVKDLYTGLTALAKMMRLKKLFNYIDAEIESSWFYTKLSKLFGDQFAYELYMQFNGNDFLKELNTSYGIDVWNPEDYVLSHISSNALRTENEAKYNIALPILWCLENKSYAHLSYRLAFLKEGEIYSKVFYEKYVKDIAIDTGLILNQSECLADLIKENSPSIFYEILFPELCSPQEILVSPLDKE